VTGFCLGIAFSVIQATIPAETLTLRWTHSVEKIPWEEDYAIRGGQLVLVAARVQGSGAGMEPPEGAKQKGHWWEYRPDVPPMRKQTLARSPYTSDYQLCWQGQCRSLTDLLRGTPSGSSVDLFPCPSAPERQR